jgi:hypothetical protein
LITYNIIYQLRRFYYEFGVYTGTVRLNEAQQKENQARLAGINEWLNLLQRMSKNVNGNFESLHGEHLNMYNILV